MPSGSPSLTLTAGEGHSNGRCTSSTADQTLSAATAGDGGGGGGAAATPLLAARGTAGCSFESAGDALAASRAAEGAAVAGDAEGAAAVGGGPRGGGCRCWWCCEGDGASSEPVAVAFASEEQVAAELVAVEGPARNLRQCAAQSVRSPIGGDSAGPAAARRTMTYWMPSTAVSESRSSDRRPVNSRTAAPKKKRPRDRCSATVAAAAEGAEAAEESTAPTAPTSTPSADSSCCSPRRSVAAEAEFAAEHSSDWRRAPSHCHCRWQRKGRRRRHCGHCSAASPQRAPHSGHCHMPRDRAPPSRSSPPPPPAVWEWRPRRASPSSVCRRRAGHWPLPLLWGPPLSPPPSSAVPRRR